MAFKKHLFNVISYSQGTHLSSLQLFFLAFSFQIYCVNLDITGFFVIIQLYIAFDFVPFAHSFKLLPNVIL